MSGHGERIRDLLVDLLQDQARRAGLDVTDIDDDTDVLGSGVIDSLAFVDLLITVESRLGASLALDQLDFEQIDSLGTLVDALCQLTEAA